MLNAAEHDMFSINKYKNATVVGISYYLEKKCSRKAIFSVNEHKSANGWYQFHIH